MANNIYRLITNIRRNPKLNKLLTAIDNKYPEYALGANTPLPNQALETATYNGNPSCLIFQQSASKKLQTIRNLAQAKSNFRFNHGKKDTPIEFLCVGYMDFAGDIVITDTFMPALDIYKEAGLEPTAAIYNSALPKDVDIVTQSQCFDYLKENKMNFKGSIGYMPVALMGTTRPITNIQDGSEYCPKFSEISRAILPANVEINHAIMSGILSVSPKYQAQTPNGNSVLVNGSLECILIDYRYNNNHTVTPEKFLNITRCQQTLANGTHSIMDISKSKQPLDNLPILSDERIKK